MNINLREEETIQYISFYQRYLEDVQSLNNKVMDVLNEVMQQSKYDKLQHRISGIIDAYMETIVNNIETGFFQTWQESDGSLRSCLRTYRAGDAADEVCAQIEQQMEDLMQDILKIEKADLIVTERPIVSEDGLEQLEDICRTAQTEIQNLKTEYASQVSSKELDNDIYGTLRPLIEGVATNMEAFFEASLNSFAELHEFVTGISTQLHDISEVNGYNGGVLLGNPPTTFPDEARISDSNERMTDSDERCIDTVFITGSGFDSAHGKYTSYGEFKKWILDKFEIDNKYLECLGLINENDFWGLLRYVAKIDANNIGEMVIVFMSIIEAYSTSVYKYDKKNNQYWKDEWSMFEDGLNLKHFFKNMASISISEDIKNGMSCNERIGLLEKLSQILREAMKEIGRLFETWICEVNARISDIDLKRNSNLSKLLNDTIEKTIFITFNYTNTLENVYGIQRVNHLHGQIMSDGTKINNFVLGFGEKKLMQDYIDWIQNENGENEISENISSKYERGDWLDWLNKSDIPKVKDGREILWKSAVLKQKEDVYKYDHELISSYGEILNEILRKKSEMIISNNKEILCNKMLSKVNKIFLYGMSVQLPDYPYLMKILKESKESNFSIYLSSFSYERDRESIFKRIKECADAVGKIITIDDIKDMEA